MQEQVFPEKAPPAHRPDKPGSFFLPGSSWCIRSCSTLRVKNGLFSKCASVWSRAQQVTLATFSAYGQEFWPMRMWLLSMANGHICAWEDKNFCLNLCLWWLRQLGPTIAPFLQMVQDFVRTVHNFLAFITWPLQYATLWPLFIFVFVCRIPHLGLGFCATLGFYAQTRNMPL